MKRTPVTGSSVRRRIVNGETAALLVTNVNCSRQTTRKQQSCGGEIAVITAGGASYTDQIQVPSISINPGDLTHGPDVMILQYPPWCIVPYKQNRETTTWTTASDIDVICCAYSSWSSTSRTLVLLQQAPWCWRSAAYYSMCENSISRKISSTTSLFRA